MGMRLVVLLAGALVFCACNDEKPEKRGEIQTEAGVFGDAVDIAASSLTAGYAAGHQRETVELEPFRIGRYPVTVARYRTCVEAEACTAPAVASAEERVRLMDRPTWEVEGGDELPVNCVTSEQAAAYCSWVGGRLPRASEWLRAARGEAVATFAWGEQEPSCEMHPVARGLMANESSCCENQDDCSAASLLRVGAHPAGASPVGLEDVLFGDAEFVTGDERSSLTHCGSESCAISGGQGRIEAIVSGVAAACAVTFRCASDAE